jgi:hypothetical protein
MPVNDTVDSKSRTEVINCVDPNDTAVLIAKAREKKAAEIGELAVIHVQTLPANVRELEEFLYMSADGKWSKYSVAAGKYIPVTDEEMARMCNPRLYALQGPVASAQDGSKDFYLFSKNVA